MQKKGGRGEGTSRFKKKGEGRAPPGTKKGGGGRGHLQVQKKGGRGYLQMHKRGGGRVPPDAVKRGTFRCKKRGNKEIFNKRREVEVRGGRWGDRKPSCSM